MPCRFNSGGCGGPRTQQNECKYCREIGKDDEIFGVNDIFGPDLLLKMVMPAILLAERNAMPAVPIIAGRPATDTKPAKPKVFVNKGEVLGRFDIKQIKRSAGDTNCALCAAAGAVNLAVGYVKLTTRKVAKLDGVQDNYEAWGFREEQEVRLIRFVSAQLPEYARYIHGSDRNRMDLQSALAIMGNYPDNTVFVISCAGTVSRAGEEIKHGSWGHWLNAIKLNGSVLFVDFQTDHEQRLGRGFVSSEPILGNFGVEWDDPRLQVIAFRPPQALPAALPQRTSFARPRSIAAAPLPSATNATATPTPTPLALPLLPTASVQQVVPLTPPPKLSTRKQRGQAMLIGTKQQLDQKLRRQGGNIGDFTPPQ